MALPDGGSGNVDILFTYRLEGEQLRELPVCKENQRKPINRSNFPRLKARPGELVISSHFENGHVTLQRVENPAGFPGFMYWFGTGSPREVTTFGEVLSWGDGKEGPKNGTLLKVNPYDDGLCAEPNGTPLSAQRGVGPTRENKACRGNFRLPADLKSGSTYTVYWVWDFSWHFSSSRREEVSTPLPVYDLTLFC